MDILRKQINEKVQGGTVVAGKNSDASVSDTELKNKVDILEKKLDDMNKEFGIRMEGLLEIIKHSMPKQSRPNVSEEDGMNDMVLQINS